MANKPELKDTTRSNYLYMYNKYVRNDIGKKKIASIKYSDVKAFYNKLIKEKGFKPNSMEIIHTIIHPISVSTRLPERWRKSKRATTGRSQSVTR